MAVGGTSQVIEEKEPCGPTTLKEVVEDKQPEGYMGRGRVNYNLNATESLSKTKMAP